MLTILGKPERFCDGLTRRNFLKIGGLAGGALTLGGPTLADVLRAESGKPSANKKSIINIFLGGGPPHLDMFDLKPQAPAEIRGEFLPISTNVPGIEICSLMPNLAKLADKFAIIRSLTGFRDEHTSWQTETGWSENDLRNLGGYPSLGAVVAKLQGATNGSIPSFIDLNGHTHHGFLGPTYSAFRPDGPGRANLTLNGISLDRLRGRAELLGALDRVRRDMDGSRMMEAIDSFNQRAIGVITSSKLADALRTEKEDANVKERYGLNRNGGGENQRFLLSRRLIETGARSVSFSWGGWDTHGDNFNAMRRMLPMLDVGLSALIQDLDERGMLDNTAVVMWGEFGRTPRINSTAGRDHWARASSAFVAGGGMKLGQVIGATNRYGEAPTERPVHLHEVFATFYHLLGIDPKTTTLQDPNGRPQYLVNIAEPIRELVG
ncbi:MAG: DUF1501 domain-containing protein [Pirellulales bacterium]